jgi:hypothetical protein
MNKFPVRQVRHSLSEFPIQVAHLLSQLLQFEPDKNLPFGQLKQSLLSESKQVRQSLWQVPEQAPGTLV